MRPLVTVLIAVGTFGVAFLLCKGIPKPADRFILIHSDDAGMYPSVNAATIEALEHGSVTSCSIMVPCPAFAEFATYAATHPEHDYGVHLTLNCDTATYRWGPVSPRQKVPSLVDRDGFFWSTTEETARHARLEEVEIELRAQVDKARSAGIRLSHLDHHMFVLFERSDLVRLYVRLGLEYDLPIRYTQQVPEGQLDAENPEIVAAYKEGLENLEARGMPIFTEIDSRNYGLAPERKRGHYLSRLGEIKPGVTEFLIHCAYGPPGPQHAPNADRREADMRVFTSQEMADAIRRCGILAIDWRAFRQLNATTRIDGGRRIRQ
jgi:chitin disaccharide deacetylase